jgi:cell division septum initiation protein DivIVA
MTEYYKYQELMESHREARVRKVFREHQKLKEENKKLKECLREYANMSDESWMMDGGQEAEDLLKELSEGTEKS